MNSLAIFGFGLPEVILILAFGLLGFWLWMLIDCLTKEEEQNQKLIWVLVIVLVGLVGAPLYFFMRKLPRKKIR